MADEREFVIERTTSTVYLDEGNNPVTGFEISVRLIEFDEIHSLNVPNLRLETVEAAATKLLAERQALADLGS